MTLFTVGPCEMYPSTLEVSAQPIPYFRNNAFSEVYLECEAAFKRFVKAPESSKFILLTASGTAAMEAVVMNCLHEGDKAIVINGGTFGARFSKLCDVHGIEHADVKLEVGETLTAAHLAPFEGGGYTALLVNIHETSTGQLYDGAMLGEFCKRNGLFFVVDAISAFAADPIDFSAWGVGALIISSQKALALAPGLAFVFLAHEVYSQRVEPYPSKTMYFDFVDYVVNGVRGQTPFTPAVGTVYQLQDMLAKIEAEGGIDAKVARTAQVAADFRTRIADLPITLPSFPLSNAMSAITFTDADAKEVNFRLEREYGLVLNPCGGTRANTTSRVAHIGNHGAETNTLLVDALREILA